ncbi:MraY family glycosyltransferase [Streptomyces sp. NPDC047017]|uniref:MraY family glycosyltransferase n=1 Tax=Streptomyces sp. NPDC047017 TaxID=3155024 RepID=UPI0033CB6A1C
MLYGIATATAALFLAAVLSALLRVPALRLGLVDRRRMRPVPLLGGVAVVGSTCLIAAAGGWTGAAPLSHPVGRLLAVGAGVAVLGLVADVWRLKTPLLLVGTAVAAAWVVPYDETGVPAGIAAVLWIACVAAAFRGLDHADGLAGTVGVITAFGAGVCAAAELMDDLAVLLSVLAAALTGFLMHNWHPARIAFGACGSLFTGFVLASSAVLVRTEYDAGPTAAVLFPLTATAVADAVLVVLSRRLAGRPVLRRGPDHLAHRLRRLGLTPPGATVLIGVCAFATVLVGVLVHLDCLAPVSGLWTAGAVSAAVLGLLCVRVYGPRRPTGTHATTATGTRTSAAIGTRASAADAYGTRTRAGGRGAAGVLGTPRSPGGVRDARASSVREARAPGRDPRTPPSPRASRTRRPYDLQDPADAGRSSGYPVPPPQQTASSQVRESLRVRDG